MASKARKERRRLERERAKAAYEELCRNAKIDESISVEEIKQTVEDSIEQAGKEAYSGFDLVEPPELVRIVRHEQPPMVARAEAETAMRGQTYEEANWAKLSPIFREAHNRLRQSRGMSPIPPPAIDLYRPPAIRKADPKELEALEREQAAVKRQFVGQERMMAPGEEGFREYSGTASTWIG